jgi:carbamoyl-phosphate synthase large subunit
MNILVTGIAGDIGSGIGRILREYAGTGRLSGCDIHGEHLGKTLFDAVEIIPRATDEGYLEALRSLAAREQAEAIVVTSEPELRFFAGLGDKSKTIGLPLVMANPKAMEVGFDKLATARFIESIGCDGPWTCAVESGAPLSLPCILKGRTGAGSRAVFIVKDPALVEPYSRIFGNFIWQEYIPGDQEEYTCGVYGCANGDIRTIILRRRLAGGLTGYAELVRNEAIEALCVRIARALDLKGSINIQLRLSPRGPLVFEINPRFSSTVVFRHKLGFTDVLWSLHEQIRGESAAPAAPAPTGAHMYKTFDEVILF